MASFDSSAQPDVAGAERGIAQLRELFAEKRARPDDTFMSTLVNHMEDGERISENEALALVGSLLAAGVDTTFDYMLNIFFGLVKNPQWGAWVKENPERIQDFIDETFRWNNFGTRGFYRFAVEDMELLGQKIKRGEIVQVMMATANHDPSVFPDPEKFDPTRNNLDKALSFGVGAHYCLGHAIAKLIAQVTTLAVINRYPHVIATREPEREYSMTARRMRTFVVKGTVVKGTAVKGAAVKGSRS
jgi:cytochrome P450